MNGEIGPDGLPQNFVGHIMPRPVRSVRPTTTKAASQSSTPSSNSTGMQARIPSVLLQILSGGNRITCLARSKRRRGERHLAVQDRGRHHRAQSRRRDGRALVLNRIAVGGRYDAAKQRFTVDEGDVGNTGVGIAMSGSLDLAGGNPRLAAGLAGTRMPADAMKRLWPVFITPKVRDWFNEHLLSGMRERIVIAVNSPIENLKDSGPPVPDDGLSIDASAIGCVVRPVNGLPALRDADMNVHIVGRDAVVSIGRATADMPSGRKLTFTSGVFEVPDTSPMQPPARAFQNGGPGASRRRTHAHGSASRRVRRAVRPLGYARQFERPARHAASRSPPGSTNYSVSVETTNFAADRVIMGKRSSPRRCGRPPTARLPAQGRCQDRRRADEPRIS